MKIILQSGLDFPASDSASFCDLLGRVKMETVGVVSMCFTNLVFPRRFRGTGYFCGSLEKQPILGMTWDSQIFPEQGSSPRLTVYIDGNSATSESTCEDIAREIVMQHLGILEEPSDVKVTVLDKAVPQYEVGHHKILHLLNMCRLRRFRWLQFVGPGYFGTRSIADEIIDARKITDTLARRFSSFPQLVENEVPEDVAERYGGGFDA